MKNIAFAVAFAMLATAPAYAGSCGGAPHTHGVSKGEAKSFFEKTDANGDGKVSKAEFDASPASKKVKSFDLLKPSSDGFVSKRSFIEGFSKHAKTS